MVKSLIILCSIISACGVIIVIIIFIALLKNK